MHPNCNNGQSPTRNKAAKTWSHMLKLASDMYISTKFKQNLILSEHIFAKISDFTKCPCNESSRGLVSLYTAVHL